MSCSVSSMLAIKARSPQLVIEYSDMILFAQKLLKKTHFVWADGAFKNEIFDKIIGILIQCPSASTGPYQKSNRPYGIMSIMAFRLSFCFCRKLYWVPTTEKFSSRNRI